MIAQVEINWDHMNDGDAYILDVGPVFFVWNGKTCSRTERIKVSFIYLFYLLKIFKVGQPRLGARTKEFSILPVITKTCESSSRDSCRTISIHIQLSYSDYLSILSPGQRIPLCK